MTSATPPTGAEHDRGPLFQRLKRAPLAGDDARFDSDLAQLVAAIGNADADSANNDPAIFEAPAVTELLRGILAGSPYLAGLIRTAPHRLARLLAADPLSHFAGLKETLRQDMAACADDVAAMRTLRRFKQEVALLTALADLGGVWPVMTVTQILTETADTALTTAVRYLFGKAAAKGDWLADNPEAPERGCGYIVLAMGKYGAGELNYSSDIDLIVFFERSLARLKPGIEHQTFFVRLTRDLVKLIDERTADGYVFRTDLRLRPDAGATQLAISTDAALQYYESFGQNWERAALIKARAAAGDIEAGEAILQELDPFIWRRYLDFAAIADVHAMKRQIHAFKKLGGIGVAGHNLKLGRGGIREIEFFVQTQQLIAGGRQRQLRLRGTLETLDVLAERGWIKPAVRDELKRAYCFLRELEHRVQMVADEQTHALPSDPDRLENFARFAGYSGVKAFSASLLPVLETVQARYGALFEDMPELTTRGANMVFAGSDNDPDTMRALHEMGYTQPATVIATVRGWHHGRYAAVRSPRSQERLTEVQPLLIEALAGTADPDAAIAAFDRFVSELPAGVQLFSLLRANPGLLRLIADIMGTSPRLAHILSRRRRLLDAVIDPRTFDTVPTADELEEVIRSELARADDYQELLDRARIVGSEQWFLVGLRVLSGAIDADLAGQAYARIAESLVEILLEKVAEELAATHGRIPGGNVAVLGMGKLGSREMTAGSDLDLIVIYSYEEGATQSDGDRPLAPGQYYARLTQRLISAISAPTPEGTLYEVDMRLRPSGLQGPVATKLTSFREYQASEAWTWEHMALTRARAIAGPPELRSAIEAAIRDALLRPRDTASIAADVREMRQRIWAEKGSDDIWNIKHVRGGLIDLEFIVQYLQIVNAAAHPEVLDTNTLEALRRLRDAGLIEAAHAEALLGAGRLLNDLTQVMRVCSEGAFRPESAPLGMRQRLIRAADVPTFEALEELLATSTQAIARTFGEIIGADPATG
ncbi:MAG: bifunctional [glutamine synthetase] adenylyltransferase/[glutamine synthetase]-adenylyl-L-tyrosine phosphorylase [Alphaproteobacteria bacterium]|nr:bifunctional [glutamine synthetase] adenylyltransferase/[glutamine synthetase]-adenylyl-L-tyrosine phosphorylase [Alphaproteobacteria bacterium]